jgi:hypothetical protein
MPSGSGAEGGVRNWPPNLLARIASTIGRSRQEDIASGALLHVIQTDNQACRAVVSDLVRTAGLCAALLGDLYFDGQVHGVDGRPDIVGSDDSGRTRLIIEAKIDMGFEPDQIGRYSSRLEPGLPSVMAVLAPERRLPGLLHEAARQLAGRGIALTESGAIWRTADKSLTLLGISWLEILAAIEGVTSSIDLAQLRGFYEHLEPAVFLPLTSADIARANGRLMWSVSSIAENVAKRFPGGNQYHQWGSFGRLLDLDGRTAWFGVWLEAWAQRDDTPYWLTYSKNVLPPAKYAQLLPELRAIPGVSVHLDETYLCIALIPPVAAERLLVEDALALLIAQVTDVVQKCTGTSLLRRSR